jgi:small ligand-binding sensory domain FIST
MRVTGAHENVILEIEGRPALDVLRELAPADMLDDPTRAMDYLFVGLVPFPTVRDPRGGEYLIRNIVAIDPDTGVLGIGAAVDEGQRIVFAVREGRAAREDVLRMARDLQADASSVDYRFGLYFNCVARGRSLYGEDGVDARLIRRAFPDIPVIGFFCNAELAPTHAANRLYTYTGVLVLVGEHAAR